MGKINFHIIDDHSEMKRMREVWNALLEDSSSNTIFLTWEWMNTWWECFSEGKELFIIVAENNGSIVGIAPLYITRTSIFGLRALKHLEFLGTTGVLTEYLDFIIRKGHEQELVPGFMEFIFESSFHWDVFNVVSMRQDAINFKLLKDYYKIKGLRYWEYNTHISPYIELPSNFDDYMKSLSRNTRWRFRSLKKKLAHERQVDLIVTTEKNDVMNDFSVIKELHQKRWEQKGDEGTFSNSREKVLTFHDLIVQRFFDNGWLYLLQLKVEGVPVAGQYNFFYNKIVFYHSVGFDPGWAEHNVGTVLQIEAIENSILKGAREFDLLRGAEQYKYIWAKKEHVSVDAAFWHSNKIAKRVETERKLRRAARSLIPKKISEMIYKSLMTRNN